jgi:tetratricopeptide (TPR) repeat protein
VLKSIIKLAAAAALLSGGVFVAMAQEKKVKDQGEFDIYTAAAKETDPQKKIQYLLQWKEKYPTSDYKEDRQVMIVMGYQGLRQGDNMWSAAVELLNMNPASIPAVYFLTSLTTSLNKTDAEHLDTGEKASRALLGKIDEMLAKSNAAPEAKAKEKLSYETLARRTLGWIEMSRKNNEKAEQEFTDLIKLNPNSGQVPYWLGTVILAQKKPEKQVAALWQFARAANYKGEDALPEASRTQLQGFLERNYVAFRGKKEGLQEMIDRAMKEPFAPADFRIKSVNEEAVEAYNKLLQEDPQKATWLNVRNKLIAEGDAYFDSDMKGAALPKLKGKVVSMNPPTKPKEIEVAIFTEDGELKLVLDAPFPNPAEIGTVIEFEGTEPKSWTKEPFQVVGAIEKAKITGWPAAPKPAPVKPGLRKAPVGKKK